jgi:hypothetical protein
VTGWNEWKASVWENPGVVMLGRKTTKGLGYIVDEFNMDFNRDVEPMRGGYGDNYYWQFLSNMRMYKGMEPPETASPKRTIRIDGDLSQWDSVRPVFRDAEGDTANRDWDGTVPQSHYADKSARNDIVSAQVSFDDRNVYFRVRTSADLTQPSGRSWMCLLIDTARHPQSGWNGYEYLIDRDRVGDGCTIEKNVGGLWAWKGAGMAKWHRSGRDLVLSVPRRSLGLTGKNKPVSFDFKWADNLPEKPDIMDFYTEGDVAPDARFNYRYVESARDRLRS